MEIKEKLEILSDSAKYDASCSSSGSKRDRKGFGSVAFSGICHSFSSDGRCISLLKILMTNICIMDCKYCINRRSNDVRRAVFTPEEICEITLNFYKRNYIEGLFLSSGIIRNADYTMEKLIETLSLLRKKYHFTGYIHTKVIPGASPYLIKKIGTLADRVSANIELPSNNSLKLLAPEKDENDITKIMNLVKNNQSKSFVSAGQSTQMIIGGSPESDYQILSKSEFLYQRYKLKRVFYSAYIPVNKNYLLPKVQVIPLKRENRLYQADWLLRFYPFQVKDLLDENNPNFNILLDPKADWALRHLDEFPKEINKCSYLELLKIPGIGMKNAKKIVMARKKVLLDFNDLKNMQISLKRAKYFITCNGNYFTNSNIFKKEILKTNLLLDTQTINKDLEQMRLF